MKKYTPQGILLGILIILSVPSVSFAAWWNPFTWSRPKTPVVTLPIKQDTTLLKEHPAVTAPVKIADIKEKAVLVQPIKKISIEKKVVVEKPIKIIEKKAPEITPIVTADFVAALSQPDTILCNGKSWTKCPSGQDFICPASGDARCQLPPQQNSASLNSDYQNQLLNDQLARQAQVQQEATQQQNALAQEKQARRNTLTSDYNSQISALSQQILDIKQQYYVDIANNEKRPVSMNSINGTAQRILSEANLKIDQLNLQIQQLNLDYTNKLNQL